MSKKIPFGIIMRGQKDYAYSELSMFIECADSIEPMSLRDRYIDFLEDFLGGDIKKSTMVDIDVLKEFRADLDNRADIDYREGHWDDEPTIYAGGKYFAKMADKLRAHINASA